MVWPGQSSRPHAKVLAAEAWAQVWEALDRQLSPLGLRAIDALGPKVGETIADIGCGAGQTVIQLANRVGPYGRVIGVDFAPQMLALARRRSSGLSQVHFVDGDAARLDLPQESLDGLYSRFGVMAFEDPIKAFSHLRRLLKPTGRLSFVCWRALNENELDQLPLQVSGLESMLDPTPFSLAEPDHVRTLLQTAGFDDIRIQAYDAPVSCGDLDATLAVLLRVGPLGKILRETPERRTGVEPRLRPALAARGDPGHVVLMAAVWIVSARVTEASDPGQVKGNAGDRPVHPRR